jgi:hypothetical protein
MYIPQFHPKSSQEFVQESISIIPGGLDDPGLREFSSLPVTAYLLACYPNPEWKRGFSF